MDHRFEALIGFVAAHGDAFELFEFTEEVLDQMPPFVPRVIDCDGVCAARVLRDDDLAVARVEVGDDGLAVEGLVGNERSESAPNAIPSIKGATPTVSKRCPGARTK